MFPEKFASGERLWQFRQSRSVKSNLNYYRDDGIARKMTTIIFGSFRQGDYIPPRGNRVNLHIVHLHAAPPPRICQSKYILFSLVYLLLVGLTRGTESPYTSVFGVVG